MDKFAQLMEIDSSLFCIDSTMVDTLARDMSRLELLYVNNERILGEQCRKDGDGPYVPKGKGDGMGLGMAQSPHDTDATYREKDGEKHKGYVTGFARSRAPRAATSTFSHATCGGRKSRD